MRDFFAALQSASPSYPLNPFIGNAVPPAEDLTLPMYCACPPGSASIPLGQGVKLLLTDGRTFRTRTNMDAATVFGAQQWDWLANELNAVDVILLACGSTLDHGGTPLDLYGDYEKLVTLSQKKDAKLLCLTGDVHKIDWRNKHGGRIFEAVASGAARTKFGTSGAYGLAEISDTDVSIRLYENSLDPTSRHSIGRDTWQEH